MQSKPAYHHGDLPAALVRAAIELLDAEGFDADLSLRAVARRAGVSTGAPYRHFADRSALLAAVAAVGYRQLTEALRVAESGPDPSLADVAVAYVRFAIERPGLFRVMFAEGCCQSDNADLVAAVADINAYLLDVVTRSVAADSPEVAAVGAWALVHGLAFLYLDGKLDSSSPDAVAETVRSVARTTLGLSASRS